MAVLVVLAVRLVVLVVVGDQVMHGETIVRGDEVDAGPGLAAAAAERIRRCGEARRHFGGLAFVAFPERAHGVAELVVPFSPTRWEAADLIAAGTDVPRFGDHLHR